MRDSSKMNFTFSSCDITLPKPSLSCGRSGTGETTGAYAEEVGVCAGKAHRAPPAESEHPETEINYS